MYVCTYVCVYSMSVCMYVCTYVCVYSMYVCMYVCTYVCVYSMYVCMYVCTYVCVYSMYVCMYVCVYTLGLGDIDFFCVSRYLRRVSRYTRYIGGIQIIGNQSDT